MSYFKFCPNCSSQQINFENNRRLECFDCGLVYYQNVATAVAVILLREDEVLFTIRNQEPKKEFLDLPGGFTDPDETAEQTCKRELKEELNIDIPLQHFTYFTSQPNNYSYKGIPYKTEDLVFIAEFSVNQKITLAKDEIENVQWIKITDIDLESIGFDSLRKAIKIFIKQKLAV